MKKSLLALLSILSILFFSCASKEQITDEAAKALEEEQIEAPVQTEEQAVTQADEVAPSANTEITEQTTDENTEQSDGQEENLSEDEDSDVIVINELVNQELEEIIEPEVFELELPEEPEELPEPVAQELTLEEVEIVEETVPAQNEENNVQQTDEADVTAAIDEADENQENAVQTMDTTSDDEVITIDDENDFSQNKQENTEISENTAVIEPSRSVTLKRMEYLEVSYPGNGWIYMGITDGSKDLTNLGRKVGTQNTTFTLAAKNAGTKILHFYKNDAVTNTFIDDYLEVIVLDEKGSNKKHVQAPVYKVPVPKKPVKPEPKVEEAPKEEIPQPVKATEPTQKAEPVKTEPVKAETLKTEPAKEPVKTETPKREPVKTEAAKKSAITTEPVQQLQDDDEVEFLEQPDQETTANEEINTDDLLKQIKDLYNSKDYADALNKLKVFFEFSTKKCDEALYIQGQIYESKSSVQNINAAIESYTTLTKNYPASKFWDDANKRIIYLKRFYLEGR